MPFEISMEEFEGTATTIEKEIPLLIEDLNQRHRNVTIHGQSSSEEICAGK